ncbi:MAG: LysM peptidoglycan-binding domain-containing protein [Planctomycetota bacterium]|jgi:nucleoid-associated protein YgaU
MSSGTRIALALIAIFVGVLVVYYGFIMPTSDAPPTGDELSQLPLPEKPREEATRKPATPARTPPVERPAPPEVVMGEPTALPKRPEPAAAKPPAERKPLTAARTGRLEPAVQPAPPATTRTPVPPPTRPQPTIYTVKDGDTMSSIAIRWFDDEQKWHLIAKANPLVDPNRLRVGQTLRLPPRGTPREPVPPAAAGESRVYTVRSGDTLSTIAIEVYGSSEQWKAIYAANRDKIGSDPDRLKVGMELTLPAR